jgi:hypothetical protein
MVKCTQFFKEYYDAKTSHRRLQWVHGLGDAQVRAVYKGKSYDLAVGFSGQFAGVRMCDVANASRSRPCRL